MRSIILIVLLSFCSIAVAQSPKVEIPSGEFQPLFGSNGAKLEIRSFFIDEKAVTNDDFFYFVKKDKNWMKSNKPTDFFDENYLAHWQKTKTDFKPKPSEKNSPITNISWFAASAYCDSLGGRLPSTLEWEFVAAASEEKFNAAGDTKFQEKILLWYSTPAQLNANSSRSQEINAYKIKGLLGGNWEWTSDFNSFFVTADNRQDGDQSKNFFCGGASTSASARDQYPTFMRYALRSSLQAKYSLNNLGFRCAYDKNN